MERASCRGAVSALPAGVDSDFGMTQWFVCVFTSGPVLGAAAALVALGADIYCLRQPDNLI